MTPDEAYRVLNPTWRRINDNSEVSEQVEAELRKQSEDLAKNVNNWAMDSIVEGYLKDSPLTKPCNCDSLVADANKVCEEKLNSLSDEQITIMEEHNAAMKIADKRIKELEAQLPCPPPTVCQQVKDMSAWEMIAEGIKKLFRV